MTPRILAALVLAAGALPACNPAPDLSFVWDFPPARFLGWDQAQYRLIECGGPNLTIAACHDQARRECPEGYDTAEERVDEDIHRRKVIVYCRPSQGG